jgi:beta-lactamase class A
LQQELSSIAKESGGKLYTACALAPGSRHAPLACDREPDAHPPMQSVFKLPLGIYALHLVESGKLQLDQPVRFEPADRFLPKSWSPLQDKYPNANVDVPLRDLLQLAVSQSDNAAADIVLRLVGGTAPVQQYITSLGVQGFMLRHSEHELHRDERLQYQDWFAPRGAVQLLRRIADRSPLNAEHTALLLQWMQTTRLPRLAALLPAGTVVAHKTGTSGMENGVAAATNDIGLVTLPDGERLAIAIFLTDSTADDDARDKAIGRAALAIYRVAANAKAAQ